MILNEREEEEGSKGEVDAPKPLVSRDESKERNKKYLDKHMEAMEEDGAEDMELGELDLDVIEKECEKKGKG